MKPALSASTLTHTTRADATHALPQKLKKMVEKQRKLDKEAGMQYEGEEGEESSEESDDDFHDPDNDDRVDVLLRGRKCARGFCSAGREEGCGAWPRCCACVDLLVLRLASRCVGL